MGGKLKVLLLMLAIAFQLVASGCEGSPLSEAPSEMEQEEISKRAAYWRAIRTKEVERIENLGKGDKTTRRLLVAMVRSQERIALGNTIPILEKAARVADSAAEKKYALLLIDDTEKNTIEKMDEAAVQTYRPLFDRLREMLKDKSNPVDSSTGK